MNRLHGPPKESKIRHREGLKGLLPYIRAVYAIVSLPMMAIRGQSSYLRAVLTVRAVHRDVSNLV